MIGDFKPYHEYKDSGLPWLGRIPKHWDMLRMKHLFSQRNVRGFPDEPMLAATQTKGVVKKDQYDNRTVLALKDIHLLKLVEVGDFVISLRSFQGGIEYARHRGIISPAYTILYTNKSSTHTYFAALFKSRRPFIDALRLYVTGIRQGQNIDYASLSRSLLPLPPEDERKEIGAFVNHVNQACLRFIRNRRRLIEVLTEQKQAIINQAVTRGLSPTVPLKPSGIDWSADIPEHWHHKKLKHIATIKGRIGFRGYTTNDQVNEGQGALVIGASHIDKNGLLNLSDAVYLSWDKYYESPEIMVKNGDIVFVQRGSTCGKVGLIESLDEHVTINPSLILIKEISIKSRYLFYVMHSQYFNGYFKILTSSTAIPMISQYQLENINLFIPDNNEQEKIVKYLDKRLVKFSDMITAAQKQIDYILKYRTRLISDVVTGKVDVRHLAPASGSEDLEEKIDELEPLDEAASDLGEKALAEEVSYAD